MFQRVAPMDYKAGGDLRLVMLQSCQSGCGFCHDEGHKSKGEIGTLNAALASWKTAPKTIPLIDRLTGALRDEDVDATIKIARKLGLSNIHLTGGEPTLHPHAVEIINRLLQAGLQVGMTTHGEYSQAILQKFLESGISSINFSLHALTPEQYLAMDLVAQQIAALHDEAAALRFAEERLRHKLANIQQAVRYAETEDSRLSVKVNTVVLDTQVAYDIVRWCNEVGAGSRLQRDLNNKARSRALIEEVIARLDAYPVREDNGIGDSSGSGTVYEFEGGTFKVKSFGEVYVRLMCANCALKGKPECRERFYGLRIERGMVTTCIDVQEPGVTQFTFDEFLGALERGVGVPAQIREQYRAMRRFTLDK